tara:strand:+ start:6526 stop:7542 length:1017 start_codon:yes stop_codon:yes gene_type:complete
MMDNRVYFSSSLPSTNEHKADVKADGTIDVIAAAAANTQRPSALIIARHAIKSLHAELLLYPKPGLVSPLDNGSHTDMDSHLFMRSIFSLRHYFLRMAKAGAAEAPFVELKQLGMQAEQRMMAATGGINTHRGAIFSLGLLCAAAGYCHATRPLLPLTANYLRRMLLALWGEALATHSIVNTTRSNDILSNGTRAAAQYGVSGAREEAAQGFPSIFDIALPRLQQTLATGRSDTDAQIDALFSLMANMNDTNIYHRGGTMAASLVRQSAQQFLAAGGTAHSDWRATASRYHQLFVQHRISPGGAADLLSASWFVHLLVAHNTVGDTANATDRLPSQYE